MFVDKTLRSRIDHVHNAWRIIKCRSNAKGMQKGKVVYRGRADTITVFSFTSPIPVKI